MNGAQKSWNMGPDGWSSKVLLYVKYKTTRLGGLLSQDEIIAHMEFNNSVSKQQLKSSAKKAPRLALCGKTGLDCMECGSFILDS